MKSSVCSNILREEQSSENFNGNKSIKDKYERELQILKITHKKYSDELYPPIKTSLCFNSSHFPSEVKWIRLGELFEGKSITVWNSDDKCRVYQSILFENHLAIPNCFNTIKSNNFLLEKMFESQKLN